MTTKELAEKAVSSYTGWPGDDQALIYLAQPYSGTVAQKSERYAHAVCKTVELMNQRWIVYSPILHNHPLAQAHALPTDWSFWEAFDHRMILASDVLGIYRLPGWEESVGLRAEIEIAIALDKPAIYID